MREFRNFYRFIPFGKFSLSGRGKPPYNQVLVGRQKERAKFIELLTHQERFGAFLISGQRGSGKTSFVDYCLAEYKRMAYQRSIRISRTAPLLSYLFLLLFAFAMTAVYVLATQLLELGAQNVLETILAADGWPEDEKHGFASLTVIWSWIPFLLVSSVMLLPAVFAMRTIFALIERGNTPAERSVATFRASVLCLLLPLLWLWQTPIVEKISDWLPEFFAERELSFAAPELLLLLAWIIMPLYFLGSMVRVVSEVGTLERRRMEWWQNIAIAVSILTGICAGRALIASELSAWWNLIVGCVIFASWTGIVRNLLGPERSRLRALIWLAISVGALILGHRFAMDAHTGYEFPLAAAYAFGPACAYLFWFFCSNVITLDKDKQGKANGACLGPVHTILILKANFLFALTLLGLMPLIRVLLVWFWVGTGRDTDGFVAQLIEWLPDLSATHLDVTAFFILIVMLALVYVSEFKWISQDLRSYRQDHSIGLTERALNHPVAADLWQQTASHTLEREKRETFSMRDRLLRLFLKDRSGQDLFDLSKPAKLRQETKFLNQPESDRSNPLITPMSYFDKSGETPSQHNAHYRSSERWTRRRYLMRYLEYATLPHIVYTVRYPVLPIWINLGFDNLEHSRIVEAMLRQLRAAYRRTFLSLTSPMGTINAFLLVGCAILFTSFLSKSLFHVGNVQAFEREGGYNYRFEGNTVSSRGNFGDTNYCGFFEVHPEVAPNMKSLICALPYANGIMELLYAPLLQIHQDFRSNVSPNQLQRGEGRSANQIMIEDCVEGQASALDRPPVPALDRPLVYVDWSKCLFGPDSSIQNGLILKHFSEQEGDEQLVGDSELLHFVLDQNYGLPRLNYDETTQGPLPWPVQWIPAFSPFDADHDGPPTLRTYHLMLYALTFWMFAAINRRIGILPYRSNLDAMNELILLINGHETLKSGDSQPRGWFEALLPFRKPERIVETKNDPRVVEQRFIALLQKMRPFQPSYRSGFVNFMEVRPEITFVFDEMDKLSGIVDPENSKDAEGQTRLEENNRERARSLQLHQLLSDMKRLISGNSARFIFIGGRLYHDEWLADQAQRSPILNSIFNGQIYLPSLMADRRHGFGRFNDRITELVTMMYRNSRHRLANWSHQRRAGPVLTPSQTEEPTYLQFELPYSGHPRRLGVMAHHTGMRVVDAASEPYNIAHGRMRSETMNTDTDVISLGELETFEQFINFLTYRSAGNPKKLKELIQEMVEPSSFAMALPRHPFEGQHKARWTRMRYEGHDTIVLDDKAIYRIQFIDMMYRHLSDHFEGKMLERDDKVSISIFYLMDFLMKFHNRGFSRTNLQRVDELSHIHRAPDLRSVMGALVQATSERFLHRILNGVYTFRFRSDLAREIDYLSRISKEEMAAMNFTLDESQSLKGLYKQTIKTGERENIDTIAGLGELYEYDQEYEIARNYYRRAIAMLDGVQMDVTQSRAVRSDSQLMSYVDRGGMANPQDVPTGYVELHLLGDIMLSDDLGRTRDLIGTQIHWVIARLRLMLQVGQTYEQEQNFERAGATFMHAAKLSDQVLRAFADNRDPKNRSEKLEPDLIFDRKAPLDALFIRTGSIFYQSALAAAWVKEKDPESVDESTLYAEHWLLRFYAREPLLSQELPGDPGGLGTYSEIQGTDGSILIECALSHDRLGDLYFLKGRQSLKTVRMDGIAEFSGEVTASTIAAMSIRSGYLDMAQTHYATALWNLRKYLTHRFRISGASWATLADNTSKNPNPFDKTGVHPFHFHSTAADVLTDLSEVIFAKRTSLPLAMTMAYAIKDPTKPEPVMPAFTLNGPRRYRRYLRRMLNRSIDKLNESFVAEADTDKMWQTDGRQRKTRLIDHTAASERTKGLISVEENSTAKDEAVFFKGLRLDFLDAGYLSDWVGVRRLNRPKKGDHLHRKIRLSFKGETNPLRHLMAYRFFGHAAARANQKVGLNINAANEYILQAEALTSAIWNARTVKWLHNAVDENSRNHKHTTLIKALSKGGTPGESQQTDEAKFNIGTLALIAILDSVDRIQFSDRPSVTRTALNHGNPASRSTVFEAPKDLSDEETKKEYDQKTQEEQATFDKDLAEEQETYRKVMKELQADYDLAQAFHDDPRAITQACSLILSLLDRETGPLCLSLALSTYQDVLLRYAKETFDVGPVDLATLKTLAKALNDPSLTIPPTKVSKRKAAEFLHSLRKELFEATYEGLYNTLERFRFPVLNRLNGLKILTDALVLQSKGSDGNQEELCNADRFKEVFETQRNSHLGRLARELQATFEVYDSEMHFPPHKIGTSMGLVFQFMRMQKLDVIYDDMLKDGQSAERESYNKGELPAFNAGNARPTLSDAIITRESIGEIAVARLNRSQESFSQGRAYYENIAYLNYLNDDFNDRSIHFNHACGMAAMDLSEVISLIVKEGFQPSDAT